MTVSIACYCTREDVMQALDVKATARSSAQIDRVIQASTLSVEGLLHRKFWVWTGTRRFDWPNLPSMNSAYPWRIRLDQNELVSVTSFVSGGVTIPAAGYLLEPTNDGPPYDHIDVNLGSGYAFASSATWQQSQVITGQWAGCAATTVPAGALAAAITLTTATTCDVTDSSVIGVGSTIVVDSERMLVTGRSMLTTALTMQAPDMTASSANTTLAVTNGAAFAAGEILLVDSERMLVVDIAGNSLIVKRAWDGTVLAAHSGALIYAARRLTVVRGAFGTTAATHSNSAAVATAWVPPLVQSLTVAESINMLISDESGWARSIGSGESVRNASGAGLRDLRDQAYAEHGRKARMRTV